MRRCRGETVPALLAPQTREFGARLLGGDHLRRPRRLSPSSPLRVRSATLQLPLYSGCADHHEEANRLRVTGQATPLSLLFVAFQCDQQQTQHAFPLFVFGIARRQ